MNVRAVLAQAAKQLAPVSDTPALDAELLLAQVTGWNRARIMVEKQAELHQPQLEAYSQLTQRRSCGAG